MTQFGPNRIYAVSDYLVVCYFVVDTNESEGTGSTRALAYSLAGERVRHDFAAVCNIFQPYTGPCSHGK